MRTALAVITGLMATGAIGGGAYTGGWMWAIFALCLAAWVFGLWGD